MCKIFFYVSVYGSFKVNDSFGYNSIERVIDNAEQLLKQNCIRNGLILGN